MTLNVQNAKKIGIGGSKNLMNVNAMAATGITVTSNVATGTAAALYAAWGPNTATGLPIAPPVGQLTIALTAYTDGNVSTTSNNGLILRVTYTDSTTNQATWKNSDTTAVKKVFTTYADKTVARLDFTYGNSGGNIWHLSEFQIEMGPTATTYTPYVAPSEVRAIHDKDSRLLWGRLEYDTKYEGDAWQQTYSGKNLLDLDAGSLTQSGTCTWTNTTNSIVITASGTVGAQYITWTSQELDDTKTYTFSGKAKKLVKGTDGTPNITTRYRTSSDGVNWSSAMTINNFDPVQGQEYNVGGTLPSGFKYYRILLYNNTGTPVTAGEQTTFYDLQLESNSTATPYEPYVGGAPAPNPDYPQDIKVVEGPQTISLRCKNSLEYTLASLKTLNTGGTWNNNVYTWNGVTFTVNGDLTISTNGTASTAAYLILTNNLSSLTPGGVYTLSGCPPMGSANSHSLRLYTGGSTYKSDIGSGLTFVYSAQTLIRINIFGGTSANGFTFKPMLEYSKNLFDGALEPGIINGTTGASQGNNEYIRSQNYIPVKENTKYYIASTDLRVPDIFVYEYKDDYTYNLTSNKSIQNTDNARNFTTNSGTKYVKFRPNLKSGDIAMQFTLADMTPTSYEIYCAKKVGIDLRGVNLMPMATAVIDSVTRQRMYSLAMPAGTYTVSYDLDSFEMGTNTSFGINFGLRGGDGTSYVIDLSPQTITSDTTLGRYSKTFTINAPVTDIQQSDVRVAYTWWSNGARVSISNIQIEPGDDASTYQPYHAPYELVKAGIYSDYIYKDGNDWKLKKKINKKTYNGSEDITYHSNRQGVDSFRMPTSESILHGSAVLSPYFMPSNFDNYYNYCQYGEMCAHNSNDVLNFYASAPDSSITTVAQFQTWLSSHNTTAYYVPLVPTDTAITDAVLIEKLNSIHDWLNRYGYHADVVGDLPIVINQESL